MDKAMEALGFSSAPTSQTERKKQQQRNVNKYKQQSPTNTALCEDQTIDLETTPAAPAQCLSLTCYKPQYPKGVLQGKLERV